jgi:hypothetical protein
VRAKSLLLSVGRHGHLIRNTNQQVTVIRKPTSLFGVIGTKGVVRNRAWLGYSIPDLGRVRFRRARGTERWSHPALIEHREYLGVDAVDGLVVHNGSIVQSFAVGSIGAGSRSYAGGLVATNNRTITRFFLRSIAAESLTHSGQPPDRVREYVALHLQFFDFRGADA